MNNNHNSSLHPVLLPESIKSNKTRQEFWNGTLVDNYNFLMSEELIWHCKSSLGEQFSSLNDLAVHHVSYNEFEKQYIELSDWCEKNSDVIKQISSNTLTCYLRQKYYEELYEQGLMRLRMFNQYSNKLIERFPDLKIVIKTKMEIISKIWNELEARFIGYLDEDFDRIIQDLHSELFLFEEWIIEIEEQLGKFNSIKNIENFQQLLNVQDEIKSKNSRVASVIEICDRLKNDYKQQIEQIPFDYASDLENRWHQIWIYSVEIQCKLEERSKILKHSVTDEDEEDDIIPFNSSEYEKISVTSSNSSSDNINSRKRHRSSDFNFTICCISSNLHRKMAKSKRLLSLNILPNLTPSTFYYSLTNINDYDDDKILIKKQKKTSSKLDIGYASEDDFDKKLLYTIKKSQSDYTIGLKTSTNMLSPLTQSLPLFEHNQFLPEWWRHSITSAYDTCSNPDIDLSIEETKKATIKPSLLMYSKKYTKIKQKSTLRSNSYDASAEYTDPEQSENDVDILSSDLISSSIHRYQNSESLFYNRYTTTTTGYSSDIVEHDITTIPSEIEDHQLPNLGEVSQMNTNRLNSPLLIPSYGIDPLNTITINDKIESSEPCWDGYQNPLFYPLNSQDIDSFETTLKWDDQFFEMDQPCNSTSDDDIHIPENFKRLLRNNNSSSSSLIASVTYKQQLDSDSDLDDFNYVINETERQLFKTRQSLEKKKRHQQQQQQQLTSISNDRNQRKYDEILRTCQTNVQCLQQILKYLHHSKNSHLNSTRAIELLQTYLSDWHDMQQQVNDDRTRARHLLHISQEIIKLKLRLDEELSHINTSFNHSWFDKNSLNELKHRIYYEIELEKENRQKLNSFYTDIHLAEQHLKEYRMTYPDGPSSFNIDEHLHSNRQTLEQLTNKMDSYQIQLRTLLTMIDNLLPIENHIEQKLSSIDYPIDFQELQTLIDNYDRMIPMNNFYLMIKNHCEYKLDIYRKMFNDLIRKQEKHVSFDGSINFNNNNSTTINSSTSSNSSTPQQQYTNESFRNRKTIYNKYRQTETRDTQQSASSDTSTKQSTTSSYISDDCKVLYIETVIEVAKPVFYERTSDTLSTTKTESHHHHHIPQSQQILRKNRNKYLMDDITNNNHPEEVSSDDDSSNPVNIPTKITRHHLNEDNVKHPNDSGIDLEKTSSSSTINNHRTPKTRLLFPSTNGNFDEIPQPTLLRRVQKQTILEKENQLPLALTKLNQSDTYWNQLKQKWFRSLLIGLFLLLSLFIIYLNGLDRCSRSTMIQTVCRKIICIESEGLPTI